MIRRIFFFTNVALSGVLFLSFVWIGSLFLGFWEGEGELASRKGENLPTRRDVPPFQQSPEAYAAIANPLLRLSEPSLYVQLPDLRKALSYVGRNGRPDVNPQDMPLYFLLTGDSRVREVEPRQPAYLLYDIKQSPPRYKWSPENQETPLWLEATPAVEEVVVYVKMRGPNGELIKEEGDKASFTLKERPQSASKEPWMINNIRVDGAFLARQQAKWQGIDLFIKDHGGEDYAAYQNKQRIDFGTGADLYSIWAQEGSCFVWDDKWKPADLADPASTRDKPLLCVKQVSDRVMNLVLWDVGGRRKVSLTLIKATESWHPATLEKDFHLVGVRTRTQAVVEVRGEREVLSAQDWLLFKEGAWKKLKTLDEIENYVDRKLVGPLFIVDKIEREEGDYALKATLYSSGRTDKRELVLTMQEGKEQSGKQQRSQKTPVENAQQPSMESPQQPPKESENNQNKQDQT